MEKKLEVEIREDREHDHPWDETRMLTQEELLELAEEDLLPGRWLFVNGVNNSLYIKRSDATIRGILTSEVWIDDGTWHVDFYDKKLHWEFIDYGLATSELRKYLNLFFQRDTLFTEEEEAKRMVEIKDVVWVEYCPRDV